MFQLDDFDGLRDNKSMSRSNNPTSKRYKYLLALGALGVVYGDIGTSPLYALKESFHPGHHMLVLPENIFGLLSLIFWSLMIVISLKYLTFILRADNKGEGGILALTSLIIPKSERFQKQMRGSKKFLIMLGLFGTALLVGDGMITPAISILSAVEGLSLVTPVFTPYVVPLTIGILIGLFRLQKRGTGTVGKIFGPVMLIWFLTLAALGITSIAESPEVLQAINPMYIFSFFKNNSWHGFVVLGSVFLVVTGGEALYSDLGHFGRKPISRAWFFVALPGLVLNYFGQGALLLRNSEAVSSPFFHLAPQWALTPLVILAALATTVASQALISGVFSLTMQAVQNGYIPRVHISHTSKNEFGQIYVKHMNRLLACGSIALVLAFKTSSQLAAAYGLAVTTTMVITTILFYIVARERWRWNPWTAGLLCGGFLVIDLAFFGSNLLKIVDGGWFPLTIGITGFTLMTTWKTGRRFLSARLQERIIPLSEFLEKVKSKNVPRVDGIAVYMNRSLIDTPYALVHTFEHFKTIHRTLIFLAVQSEVIPKVDDCDRSTVIDLSHGIYQVTLRYGYLEQPNVPFDLSRLQLGDLQIDQNHLSYIIGRESLYATEFEGMAIWREKIFSLMLKNQIPATDYFQLPKDRVVEIGVQIAI